VRTFQHILEGYKSRTNLRPPALELPPFDWLAYKVEASMYSYNAALIRVAASSCPSTPTMRGGHASQSEAGESIEIWRPFA